METGFFKFYISKNHNTLFSTSVITLFSTSAIFIISGIFFSGKISNWKALGGADRKNNVYTRDAGSGTRKVFWKKALDKGPIVSSANFVKSNGAMKVAISSDSYGIGYISVGHLDETVKGVSINGVSPTLKNIEKGDYKIARGLYSLTKGEPGPLAFAFINYLYSEPGQKIITKKGFIPVK
jgi:phosphate transport system substrate-binding protein